MERGILLEVEGRTAVVLTPGGEFKRIPAPAGLHQIGDEVIFAAPRPVSWLRWGVAAAAAAILVVAGGAFGYQTWTLAQPAALVSIDINPSIQLTLNKKEQVLRADAMNDDGRAILEGMDWKRRSVSDVLAAVTARAVEAGKLDPADETGAVLVAVAPAKADDLPAALADQIRSDAKEAVVSSVTRKAAEHEITPKTTVAAVETTGAERDEAAKAGLTPGKLVLLRELQAKRADVTAEQVRQSGPSTVLRHLGLAPSEVLSQAERDHGGKSESHPGKEGQGQGNREDATANPAGSGQKGQGEKERPQEQGNTQPGGKPSGNGDASNNTRPDTNGNGRDRNKDGGKENGRDNSKGNGKEKPSSGEGKRSSESDNAWHLPFGITVDKPGFLRKKPPQTPEKPTPSQTPRASEPGAEARDRGQAGTDKSDPKGSQKSGH